MISFVPAGARSNAAGVSASVILSSAIVIPVTVKRIGAKAFYGCKKLKTITIKTNKLTTKNVGSQAFKGIHKKASVKVPKKQKKAYMTWMRKKGIDKTVKIK